MSIQGVTVTADMAARRRAGVMAGLVVLVVLLALVSLGIGPVRLSPLTVIDALCGGGSDVQQVIVREIRLPRTILAVAIGATFSALPTTRRPAATAPRVPPQAPDQVFFGLIWAASFGPPNARPTK